MQLNAAYRSATPCGFLYFVHDFQEKKMVNNKDAEQDARPSSSRLREIRLHAALSLQITLQQMQRRPSLPYVRHRCRYQSPHLRPHTDVVLSMQSLL